MTRNSPLKVGTSLFDLDSVAGDFGEFKSTLVKLFSNEELAVEFITGVCMVVGVG